MAQKTDPQDIILVKNIDTDCTESSTDVVRTSRKLQDPETGQWFNEFVEIPEEWNHKNYFQVKWSSQPHRILPGETKLMPRYIAEHYAKYLATHMLGKMEKTTGRMGLIQSSVERPKMLARILLRVESYHLGDSMADEGARAVAEVEALNKGERALDLGTIPNPAIGVLKAEPPTIDEIMKKAGEDATGLPSTIPADAPVDQKVEEVKTSLFDKSKPLPPKGQLITTAVKLGIEIKGNESSDQLATMIRAF